MVIGLRSTALLIGLVLLAGCYPGMERVAADVQIELRRDLRFAEVEVLAATDVRSSLWMRGTTKTENDKFDAFRDAWMIVERRGYRVRGIFNSMWSYEFRDAQVRRAFDSFDRSRRTK